MSQDACDSIDVVSPPAGEVECRTYSSRKRKHDSASDQGRSSKRRNRTSFTTEQVNYLESYFAAEPYPDGMQRREISLQLHVSQQTITFWFQNRRARARKMAGNPSVLASETKKRKELPLQPATNWYFPLTSSTPVPRRRNSVQPKTSSPTVPSLAPVTHPYPTYYPCPLPVYPPTPGQTTPPPHPYYHFQPGHSFYPQWILPASMASDDQPASLIPLASVSLPSVIEITPPPSVKEDDTSDNGSGGPSHLSTPLDSPLSVHNLVRGSC